MTGPPLPPRYGTEFDNPELRAFVHQQIQQKLNQMGAHVTPEYVQDAIKIYMQPGSPLRQAFFKQKADQAAGEAKQAQYGGNALDYGERALRNAAVGAGDAFSAPGRAALKIAGWAGGNALANKLGEGRWAPGNVADDLKNTIESIGPDETMGSRGLTGNQYIDAAQTAAPDVLAGMRASKKLLTKGAEEAGNFFYNLFNKYPNSRVLQALGTVPAENIAANATLGSRTANIARSLPRTVATNTIGTAIAMPDQMTSSQGLLTTAALSALGAVGAGKAGGPEIPSEIPAGNTWADQARALFAPPPMGAPEPGVGTPSTASPAAPTIEGIAPKGPVSPRAEVEAQAASQVPVEEQPSIVQRVQQKVDAQQAGMSPADFRAAQAAQQQLPLPDVAAPTAATPRPMQATRTNRGPGFGGDKLDLSKLDPAEVSGMEQAFQDNRATLLNAKDQQDPDIVARVNNAKSVDELPGFIQRRLLRIAGFGSKDIEVGKVVGGTTQSPPANVVAGRALENAGLIQPGEGKLIQPTKASVRQGVIPPKAPEAAPPAEAAPAQAAVPNMDVLKTGSTEQIRAEIERLNQENAALKTGATPRGAAVPTTPVTTASARGAPIETKPLEAPVEAEGPAAAEPVKGAVTAGWWDSEHATPEVKAKLLQQVVDKRQLPVDPGRVAELAKQPFQSLPTVFGRELPKLSQPGAPVGGAPEAGAGFPKRRAKAARVAEPTPDLTPKRRAAATRKP